MNIYAYFKNKHCLLNETITLEIHLKTVEIVMLHKDLFEHSLKGGRIFEAQSLPCSSSQVVSVKP